MSDVWKVVCSECGSENVLKDAYVEWNMAAQEWKIQQVFDKAAICGDCGGETSLDWIRLDMALPHPSEATE